jgi:YidC/Oxa1 family membrane protein insertase
MAQQQKMLMYVFPLIFAFSGVNFPIGVLIYWTTTNLWSMGQQFYTIRRMPAPGSQAEKALKARQARKAAHKGLTIEESEALTIEEQRPVGQRQQPVGKARAKKRASSGTASQAASVRDTPAIEPASVDDAPTSTGAQPAAAKPAGAKPAGAKPAGAKPAGAKPAGGATAAGKKKRSGSGGGAGTGGPASGGPGARPSGAKPSGSSKPSGATPSSPTDD